MNESSVFRITCAEPPSSGRLTQGGRGAGMMESGASVVTEVALALVVGWTPGPQFGWG